MNSLGEQKYEGVFTRNVLIGTPYVGDIFGKKIILLYFLEQSAGKIAGNV